MCVLMYTYVYSVTIKYVCMYKKIYIAICTHTHVAKLLCACVYTYVFTEGEDFTATSPVQVLFTGGHTRAHFDVLLVDNVKLEGSEKFIVSIDPLSLPYGVSLGNHPTAEIVIMDYGGMYVYKN